MKLKNSWRAVVLGVGIAATGSCLAQVSADHAYLGGLVGQSKAKDACSDLPAGLTCNDTDTAWKIFGGYQFHPNAAVEVGYASLGESKISGVSSGVGINGSIKASAWDLVLVGSWPFGQQFSVFGKAGAYYGTLDGSITGSVPGFSLTQSAKDSNTGLTYGLGARFDFAKQLGVRVEWQKYHDVGGDNVGKSDIDLLGVALIFKFQ